MRKTINQPKLKDLVEARAYDGVCAICNERVEGGIVTPFRDFEVLVCSRHPNPNK
jgi:hypothetical protein